MSRVIRIVYITPAALSTPPLAFFWESINYVYMAKYKRKIGRPRLGNQPRTKVIAARFTAAEARRIERAKKHKPDFVREALLNAAKNL